MKYTFYLIISLIVVGLCALCWHYHAQLNNITENQTSNTTSHTVQREVITKVVEKNLPAKIDTVFIEVRNDVIEYEIAQLDTILVKDKSTVDLSISYNERLNLFSLDSTFNTISDSVHVVTTTEKVITKKPKLIGLTGGIVIGFGNKIEKIDKIGIDAGIKVVGKYSFTIGYDTSKTVFARIGIDF